MNTILKKHIKLNFINKFNTIPLLVFSPGRINLIGEHTDYNDGFVFPAAIDKGIITAIDISKKGYCSVLAIDLNETFEFNLENIQPIKNGSWKNYVWGVVAEIKKKKKQLANFNLAFGGDVPIGSGLSSSAALENSIVFGLNELFQLGLTKKEMILISQSAEHNFVGVKCGIMDQYASMFGKKNKALLLDCRTIEAKPFKIDFNDYQLLLINTNVKHSLSNSAYNDRRLVCEKIAKLLNIKALRDASEERLLIVKDKVSKEDYNKALYVIQEIDRTQEAAKALVSNNIIKLGKLIYASHNGLQHQYKVSCEELDFLVDKAKENKKIIGARMMGGGFGGCTINIIERKTIEKFITEVSIQYKEKFNIACSVYQVNLSKGTHIIK